MVRPFTSAAAVPAILAAVALVLTGCAASSASEPAASAKDPIAVVSSTNVWGDIAEQVGGGKVEVTSLISDPNRDPHDYEADPQNQLSISKARVVIENGAGYDDFVNTMLNAASNPRVTVINAADVSGYDQNPASGDFNEHLWYDFPTVIRVAERMATVFSKADPSASAVFDRNERAFATKVAALESTEATLKARYAGIGVAITEPVPLYMLDAIGLDNKTPQKFSEAIENSTDVAPGILEQTLALFTDHAVRLLAYNEQTTGAQTDAVLAAARRNGIAVVPVTETLPAGKTYLSWMSSNLSAIERALAQ